MKLATFLLMSLFTLTFANADEINWTNKKGSFAASISLSSQELSLEQALRIKIALTFPSTYRPQTEKLLIDLLNTGEFALPPFALAKQKIGSEQQPLDSIHSQNIDLYLSPQLPGNFTLTIHKITFEPVNPGVAQEQALLGTTFQIKVTPLTIPLNSKNLIAPLLPLSQKPPISLSSLNKHKYIDNPELIKQAQAEISNSITSKTFPWIILIAFASLSLVVMLVKTLPWIKVEVKKEAPTLPPKLIASQELKKLKEMKLLENKMFVPLVSHLDHIVRKYIENSFHINAPNLTTPEFIKTASKSTSLDPETRLKLVRFMSNSDNIKFAAYNPSQEDCHKALTTAQELFES